MTRRSKLPAKPLECTWPMASARCVEPLRRFGELDVLGPQHRDHLVAMLGQAGEVLERHGEVVAELQAVGGALREQQVGGAEEGGDEARRRLAIQALGRAGLEQPAHVHDADAVGEREGFLLVVRDQDRGGAEAALHVADGVAQFDADHRVERAERLVEHQHGRLVGERARHGDALLLAAGELRRLALAEPLEGDQLQQLLAPLASLGGAHAAHAQRELDVVGHGHVAEQRVVLEHEADAALPGRHVGDVPAAEQDAAMVDRAQAGERPQQRALAAAAGAEQHEELARRDVQRDVIDDRRAVIPLRDLLELDRHADPRPLPAILGAPW